MGAAKKRKKKDKGMPMHMGKKGKKKMGDMLGRGRGSLMKGEY